mmetsp:Transcript_9403/g.29670  ORF Transcript_9403/g.29670 Transcript_9403/m.29670 type:complete len:232 (+) Transcript_9403:364-1059(+)
MAWAVGSLHKASARRHACGQAHARGREPCRPVRQSHALRQAADRAAHKGARAAHGVGWQPRARARACARGAQAERACSERPAQGLGRVAAAARHGWRRQRPARGTRAARRALRFGGARGASDASALLRRSAAQRARAPARNVCALRKPFALDRHVRRDRLPPASRPLQRVRHVREAVRVCQGVVHHARSRWPLLHARALRRRRTQERKLPKDGLRPLGLSRNDKPHSGGCL